MANRLREIRTILDLTQQAMAEHLGIGKSALSMIETGKASLSERNKNILVQKLNINPLWLSSGKGEMFIKPPKGGEESPKEIIEIPLYSIDADWGLCNLLKKGKKEKPVDFIRIPNLPVCDGAVYLVSDSMYPQLKSGDIILYKRVQSLDDVFWGDTYLLSIDIGGQEYVTVKILQHSEREGFVRLISENQSYQDKELQESKIKGMAAIKASIRLR